MDVKKGERKGRAMREETMQRSWMDGEGWRAGGMDRWVSLNSNLRA